MAKKSENRRQRGGINRETVRKLEVSAGINKIKSFWSLSHCYRDICWGKAVCVDQWPLLRHCTERKFYLKFVQITFKVDFCVFNTGISQTK